MNRLDYFRARLDATIAPVDLLRTMHADPHSVCVIDVRNGPFEIIQDRIPGALQIPQNVLTERIGHIPMARQLILYCWDTWCSLAAEAAVVLLERGFDTREMYGGMKAWKTLRFPTEPADAKALAGQKQPLPL